MALALLMVEKPWSAVTTTSVEPSSPSRRRAARRRARSVSAFRTAARVVGPSMPGLSAPRLSPWLCWVPSGSRDQNTSTKGRPAALNRGSSTSAATRANQSCCSTLATFTPGAVAVPG